MEILNYQNSNDHRKAVELCKNLLEKHALIPFIGSGFSLNTPTDNGGSVPSVHSLREELFSYVEKYSGYEQNDLNEIRQNSLADLAGVFWNIYYRIPSAGLDSFYTYIDDNFHNISFRKPFQETFLKVQWPCLFSLNYDSLIEDSSTNYHIIIPYDRINPYYRRAKVRVYKLHGDAKKFLSTSDRRYFILSRDQYISSMMDDENKDMLSELLTAFSSKSILFFGCGLSDELDLLYSSQFSIQEKVKNIDPDRQAIIYISYESEETASDSEFSRRKIDQLSQYGVTHVLRIFSEQQSQAFFEELAEISASIPLPGIESFLEKHSAMQYKILETNNNACRNFLFQEDLVWKSIDSHTITLPGYYVRRSIINEAIDSISSGEPLCFISGNFFSGKTYFLIELAEHFMSKKVYIFPSGTRLTDQQLNVLLQKSNSLFCFDTKTLTTGQIKRICSDSNLDEIKYLHSSIAIVIDASDAPMYKYIFESRNLARDFQQFRINGAFDRNEEPEFNRKIGAISLPPYKKNETLLDFVVKNEKDLLGDSEVVDFFLKPQQKLLAQNPQKRTKALIMLATEIRIPAMRGIKFGIDTAINDMIAYCQQLNGAPVIEKDYSLNYGDSSGYVFVCNSKYWIIRALSTYANTQKKSIDIIADAYLSIVQDYRAIYKDDDVKFYQNSEPYYFFDHIQTLFNHRWFSNSTSLMNAIYDKLLPIMSDSFQFLHQKAKGKLIIAQGQLKSKKFKEGKSTLKEALFNITRAIQLAEQYPQAKNIQETILHMTYTKGRILIEYSCHSSRSIPQAVETCFLLYQMQQSISHDAYDFMVGAGNDKKAFEKFKEILITKKGIYNFADLDTDKVEYLLSRWTGKHFTIRKKKKAVTR